MAIRARAPVTVGAAQMDLVFDASVLEHRGASREPVLPSALLESRAAGPGRARVAFASGEPVGQGVLMAVEFAVLPGGPAASPVRIEALRAGDHDAVLPVACSFRPGEVLRAEATPAPAPPSGGSQSAAGVPPWLYALAGRAPGPLPPPRAPGTPEPGVPSRLRATPIPAMAVRTAAHRRGPGRWTRRNGGGRVAES